MDSGLVDVATGDVLLVHRDVMRPGALPLVVGRVYRSSWRAGRWFGRSWASALDQRLRVTSERVTGVFGDGRVLSWRCTQATNGPRPVTGLPVTGPKWRLEGADGDFTVTDPQAGLTWRFERRPGYRWSADQTGELPLVAVTDRAGHQIGYHCTRAGHPAWITHSAGYRVRIVMDGNRVTALALDHGPLSQETTLVRYGFNPAGDLAAVIDPADRALCFGYDEEGRLTGWDDGAGTSYRYRYDRRGRCVAGADPDGLMSATFTYGDGVTWRTDTAGAVTTYQLDESSRVAAVTDPLGSLTRYSYDENGRVTAIIGPNGLGVEPAGQAFTQPCYYDPVTEVAHNPRVVLAGPPVQADPGPGFPDFAPLISGMTHGTGPDPEDAAGNLNGRPAGNAERLRWTNGWAAP